MDERLYRNCIIALAIVLVIVLGLALMKKKQQQPSTPDTMSSTGAHWVQRGGYSHTGATLPTFDYSGHYASVPTPPFA